ncbi:hypothetical protein [Hymenobacter sp. 102]|uniref:hypothetical protein n=1 Tax=Hymenobacter sp. 102 TaxID=3403152 RepID=UPI003CE79F3D
MLHSILFAPFPDTATEARFERLQATLAGAATEGVLLVNLPLPAVPPVLALVQPGGIAVLLLLAGGGVLSTPDFVAGPWLLNGQPVDIRAGSPWQQFQGQRAALVEWLREQPDFPTLTFSDVAGLAVFTQAVQFAPDVEAGLAQFPADEQFQLVPQLPQLPRRLQQLETGAVLPPAALQHWAETLRHQDLTHAHQPEPELNHNEQPGFVAGKLRQLWGWLGAEDVPADPPYGNSSAVFIEQQTAERQQLEQLRHQMLREMQQQRQEMEAREAEREQSIAQLRDQLTHAPAATAEVTALQARLAAETQEKQQLQAAIQASQAEAEARNQSLDARIQQLGRQLAQLQAQATAVPAPTATIAPAAPAAVQLPAGQPAPASTPAWRLQWQRAALVVASVSALGVGLWGVTKLPALLHPPQPVIRQAPTPTNNTFDDNTEAAAPTLFDIQPDTIAEDAGEDAANPDEDVVVPADSLDQPADAGELLDSVAADNPGGDI